MLIELELNWSAKDDIQKGPQLPLTCLGKEYKH